MDVKSTQKSCQKSHQKSNENKRENHTKKACRKGGIGEKISENLYAEVPSTVLSGNRPRTKHVTIDRKQKTMVGTPSVKCYPSVEKRQNLLYTRWGNGDRHRKITDGESMSLNEARLRSFLLDAKGLSTKNVDTIMRNIRSLQRAWGVSEPTEESALLLKGAMRGKGRASTSIRQYMWALKYWAMAYGSDISFKAVPLPKLEKTQPKAVDFEVVGQIIEDERLSLRDRTIMLLFAITACRNGELAAIKVTDIDHKERTVLLHDTKTHKEKIAPIPSTYYRILVTYIDERAKHLARIDGKTDALIIGLYPWKDKDGNTRYELTDNGIRQALYRISERYGIDEPPANGERRKRILHPHAMRHTGTTKLMETLGNPEEVMRITGHSTSAMLDWYSHPRMEVIRAKVEGMRY